MPTAAQILIGRQRQYQGTLFDSTRVYSPLFNALQAYEMKGTSFLTMAKVGNPSATGFNRLDAGYATGNATYAMGRVNAYFIKIGIKEPVDSTDLYNSEHAEMIASGELLRWEADCIQSRLAVETHHVEKQIIQGLSNDADGFSGLKEATPATAGNIWTAATYAPESDNYVRTAYDAGGTTSGTGSSVYLVSSSMKGVSLRMGGPTGLANFLEFSELRVQSFANASDATLTNEYYVSSASGYVGLSIFGSSESTSRAFQQRHVVRAYNLTADSGKTCTEAVLDNLLHMLPPENRENLMFVMNGRSRRQVRDSKAGNSQVQISLAPGDASMRQFTTRAELPETHRGIPIIEVMDDVISSTETLV